MPGVLSLLLLLRLLLLLLLVVVVTQHRHHPLPLTWERRGAIPDGLARHMIFEVSFLPTYLPACLPAYSY